MRVNAMGEMAKRKWLNMTAWRKHFDGHSEPRRRPGRHLPARGEIERLGASGDTGLCRQQRAAAILRPGSDGGASQTAPTSKCLYPLE